MDACPRTLHAIWNHFECNESDRLGAALFAMARKGIEKPLASFADHPLADDWHDFAHSAALSHLASRRGLVYIACNPAQMGFYKVGSTAGTVAARMSSLNTAGVVGGFQEIESFACLERFGAETCSHRAMEQRAQRHKEFFFTDHRTVVDVVRACVQQDNEILQRAFSWDDAT